MMNDSVGFAVGDSGTVLMTQGNGYQYMTGRFWRMFVPEPIFMHPPASYSAIGIADPHTIYVAGDGRVWRGHIRDPYMRMAWHRRATVPKNSLTVYPDPVSDLLHVENATGPLSIFDPYGHAFPMPASESTVDVSQLSPGVYFVSDGTQRARFVKE
jgi:hypothetical protein